MTPEEKDLNVSEQIYQFLDDKNMKSFFLLAGAGSGKTRTLVEVLKRHRDERGDELRLRGKQIAVITYTNAARDEIIHRLEYDPLFYVATIHSFLWNLINRFQKDIKEWLQSRLLEEIADLEEKQRRGRAGTKAFIDREKSIESKKKRLSKLPTTKKINYSPNGENRGYDSLNHAEVVKIATTFITEKKLMREILAARFPIFLIDECQDTNKHLVDAVILCQQTLSDEFCVGFFGDTMQRIYSDGKDNLLDAVPSSWVKPAKIVNHRCPRRIIKLINKIREDVDRQTQVPREDSVEGMIRVFLIDSNQGSQLALENRVKEKMKDITGDEEWCGDKENIKILTIEHHLSASRMGFEGVFEPLYKEDRLKTGLLDGSLPGLKFFSNTVMPLLSAYQTGDSFKVARILKKESPLLERKYLKDKENQLSEINSVGNKAEEFFKLWENENDPLIVDVLEKLHSLELLSIPESLNFLASRTAKEKELIGSFSLEDEDNDKETLFDAWEESFKNPFSQLVSYNEYISGRTSFDTHQGVKGLEFPRVMLILDDTNARGLKISYEKLLGATAETDRDLENRAAGRDNSVDRTKRLFYVTCSRAKEGLAIVVYTKSPADVRSHLIQSGWFADGEIEVL